MTTHDEMDEDRRELIRGLFTATTELLETAHKTATEGQSANLNVDGYRACADKLRTNCTDVEQLAKAVVALAVTTGSQRDQL